MVNKKLVTAVTVGAFAISGLGFATIPALADTSSSTTVTNGALSASASLSGSTRAVVKWTDAASGITGFKVARDGKDSSGSGAWAENVSASAKSYEFTKLITGQTYHLTVTELLANGAVGKTVTITFKAGTGVVGSTTPAPAPSSSLAVTASTGSSADVANIRWTDSATNVKNFKVGRDGKDASGTGAWSTTVLASEKSFQFTKLIPGSTYNFTITEILTDGSQGASKTISFKAGSATTPTPAPSTPAPTTPAPSPSPSTPTSTLKASVAALGSDGARVTWIDTATGLSGFKVARDGKDASGTGAWGTTVSATTKSFDFTKLLPGSTYNFTVTEVLGNGQAGKTFTVSLKVGGTTTPTPAPSTPAPSPTTPAPSPSTPAPTNPGKYASGHTWMSGAAGVGVANGQFASWRGSAVDIVTTWSNDDANAANFWQLQSGGEYGNWKGPIDVSVGAFDSNGSWAAAANGSYDAKWRQSLTKLKPLRQGDGTTYIRFAHEMNGYWFAWNVKSGDQQNFIAAWKRYRAIQKEVFPEAKLVFSVNRESNGLSMDWRKIVPGYAEGNVKAYVDVMSVDYYNNWPYAGTTQAFDSAANDVDGYGAPKGIEQHRKFAQSVGLPLAISEWSGNADDGDSPAYIKSMNNFFSKNAGTGAGNILYETVFNVDIDNHRWLLFGGQIRMSNSATEYKNDF